MKTLRAFSIRQSQTGDHERSPIHDFFRRAVEGARLVGKESKVPALIAVGSMVLFAAFVKVMPDNYLPLPGNFREAGGLSSEFSITVVHAGKESEHTIGVDFVRGQGGSNAKIASGGPGGPWASATFDKFSDVAGLKFGTGPLPGEGGVYVGADGRMVFEIPQRDSLGVLAEPSCIGVKIGGADSLRVYFRSFGKPKVTINE